MFRRFGNRFSSVLAAASCTVFAASIPIQSIESKSRKSWSFGGGSNETNSDMGISTHSYNRSSPFIEDTIYSDKIDKLLGQINNDDIKFIRFECCNINGQSAGMLVPARNCEHFLRNGFPFVTFTLFCTINTSFALDSLAQTGFRNIPVFVDVDSYKVISWESDVRTASLLMSAPKKYDTIYPPDPRSVALQQLNILNTDYGLDILSSIEHEFTLLNKDSVPISYAGCYRLGRIVKFVDFFDKIDTNLQKIGVECDRLHSEVASGQYEITALPAWNIKGCDDAFWIKNGVREMAAKYENWSASFITHLKLSNADGFNVVEDDSGAHFNFSLWNIDKQNAFWDKTKNDLSDTALYFIGGILKHLGAVTAFCCPTTICYETRFDSPWVSSEGNWGKFNRTALIRVKPSKNGLNTHFEFRLPSSLANPYLMMAAVVCAGMDGIKNKIIPPNETTMDMIHEKERSKCFEYTVPKTLNEALEALQNDKLFCEQFGDSFISLYTDTKKMEINEMQTCKENKQKPLCYSIM